MAKKYTDKDLAKDLDAIKTKMENSTDENVVNEAKNLEGFKQRVTGRLSRVKN